MENIVTNLYHNEIPIDYNEDLSGIDNEQIADIISRVMSGYHLVYKHRFYVWNGLIWERRNLSHYLSSYIYFFIYPRYQIIMKEQQAIPKRAIRKIDDICSPTFRKNIAPLIIKHRLLQFNGQWNANKNLIVYPEGLWDMVAGAYIVNSKDYYINKVVREEPEKPNMD